MPYAFAFEGLSGAGKTTVARLLQRFNKGKGYDFRWINEKEHEPLRSWIVAWHKRSATDKVFSIEDIREIARARSAIHARLISNSTEDTLLLLDRTVYTSMAYQAQDLITPELIWKVNRDEGIVLPRRVFLFTGDPAICHRRVVIRAQRRSSYGLPASVESIETIARILRQYNSFRSLMPQLTDIGVEATVLEKTRRVLSCLGSDCPWLYYQNNRALS